MQKRAWMYIVAPFLFPALAVISGAAVAAKPGLHEIAQFYEVEFADPMAWECDAKDTCTTCKNVTKASSTVMVTHVPQTPPTTAEPHSIAAGKEVRMCGNIVYIPHSD